MNWTEKYKSKISTTGQAISHIKDNDHIVMSECAGVPRLAIQELAANKEKFHNVTIYHMLTLGSGECYQPECYGHFKHLTNFVGANTRQIIMDGEGDFFPAFFKDIPSMIESGEIPCDVAIVTATPPNEEGYCSLSLSCDYAVAAVKKAKLVIVEANDTLPFIGGGDLIHIDDVDYIVPCSYPLPELPAPTISDVEREIGKNCASLINDGDTLQLGIGAIPDAVLLFMKEKKDLGIHTEMFSDSVVDLVEAGVINGSKKTLHPGKLIATFLMGSKRLYDFVNNNPSVELYGVDYVNDPYVIAKNDNLVSINSCIEVDLMGQVASETIGLKQFSGTGGQVDYVRGASISKGGRSIMAMPSTAAKGKVSRIVPFLAHGAAVTTSRNDVDYVVTEYGIAKLKGKTLRQRALALIEIAHPDFRQGLRDEFEQRFGTKK